MSQSPRVSGSPVDAKSALESWLEVSHALVEDLPLGEMLDVIARIARDMTGNLFAMVALADEKSERLVVQGSAGLPPEYLLVTNDKYPLNIRTQKGQNETPSVRAYRTGQPVVVLDPFADDTYAEYAAAGNQQGYRAILSIPLAGPNQLGVLTVYAPTADPVLPDDIALLSALAKGAAAAIEIVRLRQRGQAMTATLQEVDLMHQRLTRVALEDQGLDSILRALSEMTGYDMLIEDELNLRRIAAWPAVNPGTQLPLPVQEKLRASARETLEVVSWSSPSGGDTIYLVPIVLAGEVSAFLWATGARPPMLVTQQRAFERGGMVIALELLKQRHAQEVEWRMRGDILRDLLSLEPADEARLLERARTYGHDLSHPHVVLVICPDPASNAPESMTEERALQHVISCARSIASTHPGHPLVAARDGAVVMLFPVAKGPPGITERVARSIVNSVAVRGRGTVTASVAVGDRCESPLEYRQATQVATGCVRISQEGGATGQVVNVAGLGIYRFLLTAPEPGTLRKFADSVLAPLRDSSDDRNAVSVKTLRSYIENNHHSGQTASALHIHPNTLAYRLKRIETLTGMSLRKSEDLLAMSFALAIERLLGKQ